MHGPGFMTGVGRGNAFPLMLRNSTDWLSTGQAVENAIRGGVLYGASTSGSGPDDADGSAPPAREGWGTTPNLKLDEWAEAAANCTRLHIDGAQGNLLQNL